MVLLKNSRACEFGDFQTPDDLARRSLQIIKQLAINPKSIIEPTCGRGSFLLAAIAAFPTVQQCVGAEINKTHLEALQQQLIASGRDLPVQTLHADFFQMDWSEILSQMPEPILVIGNPPWVTNSMLGGLQSSNLPNKSNFQSLNGLDARTGKSNFDISEWMLLQHLEWFKQRTGMMAMLCKTSVARKVLVYAWKHGYPTQSAQIYKFDAMNYFKAAVDACLFVVEFGQHSSSKDCLVYDDLSDTQASHIVGYRNGVMIANITAYDRWQHLHGSDEKYTWRSGIKHDCAKVMELEKINDDYQNGNGITIALEDIYIYPLFKSSDISNNRITTCRKYLLVTQHLVGEDTAHIEYDAPTTWRYLQDNADALAKRGSSIYKNRPLFSIFGVGHYTFTPWKVAISGFYKKVVFTAIRSVDGRPAVFDDTVYFLSCGSEDEAVFLTEILNSSIATEFLSSMIFWSDKRPITIDLLKRLNIAALARELGRENEYISYVQQVPERRTKIPQRRRVKVSTNC